MSGGGFRTIPNERLVDGQKLTDLVLITTGVVVGFSTANYICDGTADNIQIQQAIDYLQSIGGGDLYIKKGTYNLNAPIIFNDYHNINIYGENGAVLKQVAGLGIGGSITFQGASSFIKISGLEFDNINNTDFENAHCVGIRESNNIIIENCIFRNVLRYAGENGSDGIYVDVSGVYSPGFGGIENITIRGNKFFDISRNGVSVIRGNKISITDNYFCVRRSGVDLEPNNINEYIGDVLISGNNIDGVRELILVYSTTTSTYTTAAFSGNGAGIELNINEAYTRGGNIIVSNNILKGNNNSKIAFLAKFFESVIFEGNTIYNFGVTGSNLVLLGNINNGNFSNNTISNYRGTIETYSDQNINLSNNNLSSGEQAFYFQNASIIGNTIKNVGNTTSYVLKCISATKNKLIGNKILITDRDVIGILDFATGASLRASIFIDNLEVSVSDTGVLYKFLNTIANQGSEFIMKNSLIRSVSYASTNFIYWDYPNQDTLSFQKFVLQNNDFINCSGLIGGQKFKEVLITGNSFYNTGEIVINKTCILLSEVDSCLISGNRFFDNRGTDLDSFIHIFGNYLTSGQQNRMVIGNIFNGVSTAYILPANVKDLNNLLGDNLI